MAEIAELLDDFVRRFGSQTALGKAINVSASRLSRLLQGQGSLEVVNCLRLADVTGESPSVVLRAAGKSDVADLIERMYGEARPAAAPTLTPAQRELLTTWEEIPERMQAPFEVLLRFARELAAGPAAQTPATAPAPRRRRRAATRRTPRAARSE